MKYGLDVEKKYIDNENFQISYILIESINGLAFGVGYDPEEIFNSDNDVINYLLTKHEKELNRSMILKALQ